MINNQYMLIPITVDNITCYDQQRESQSIMILGVHVFLFVSFSSSLVKSALLSLSDSAPFVLGIEPSHSPWLVICWLDVADVAKGRTMELKRFAKGRNPSRTSDMVGRSGTTWNLATSLDESRCVLEKVQDKFIVSVLMTVNDSCFISIYC